MVVLIGTATRMAAGRREERYAAMRLVGATARQINVIASVDAVLGALLGAAVGIGVYAALRPALADLKLLGYRFFAADLTPTPTGYTIMLIGVPAMAAIACLGSLRRVRISPLGVSRRVTPPPPRFWRAIPLAVGLVLFVAPLRQNAQATRNSPGLAVLSLAMVMIGTMIAGPWLTTVATKIFHRYARGGSSLLAAGRLSDNPRAAYRAVSGIVLAVLVGTTLAAIVPAAIAAQSTTADASIAGALRVGFLAGGKCPGGHCGPPSPSRGLPPEQAAALFAKVTAAGGTALVPLYLNTNTGPIHVETIVSCADLAKIPAFGTCPAGATAASAYTDAMFTDNIAVMNLPFFGPDSEPVSADITGNDLMALVVSPGSPAALERVRTVLSGYAGDINNTQAPQSFAEVAQTRAELYLELQRVVVLIAALTLLIAGISLAVAISGSLVERRRAFTLLRVAGTPDPRALPHGAAGDDPAAGDRHTGGGRGRAAPRVPRGPGAGAGPARAHAAGRVVLHDAGREPRDRSGDHRRVPTHPRPDHPNRAGAVRIARSCKASISAAERTLKWLLPDPVATTSRSGPTVAHSGHRGYEPSPP